MDFLAFLVICFWLGVLISGFITLRRHQAVIRARVEARGGRPVSDAEAWSRMAWCCLKGLFWPVNLVVWLWQGRPEPGSYRRVTPPAGDLAPREEPVRPTGSTSRPGLRAPERPGPVVDPTPSGRHAKVDAPAPVGPAGAPTFPSGPATGPEPGPKAPNPPSGPKVGASGSAYVPSPSAPPPPSSTPSPVLQVPRAEFGAPQLDRDYALQVLERAGFPATPHNVFAVQERLGILFTMKARQFIEGMGTARDWATFVRQAGYPIGDMHTWPQRVLNAIARWNRDAVPHIQDFPERYSAMLLESGGFLGGSPGAPLPTATDWNMQGIAQPSARPLPAPR